MPKSFLERIQPNRARTRDLTWPFPCDGETPKVTMRVLGVCELEGAYLDTVDHFKKLKQKVPITDPAFVEREKVAIVWRAYRDGKDPIADTVDELARQPHEVIRQLYQEWNAFQVDVTAAPASKEEMDVLVQELKKNTPGVPLHALPSSWLIELCTILASHLASSTPESGDG